MQKPQSEQDMPSASHTATPSADSYGLGRTPGQRGAEILAGLRADLMPSPETNALSRFSGRLVAQLFRRLVKEEGGINYVMTRQHALGDMARRILGDVASGTVVEVAAGFSPRGLHLAQNLPHVDIVEIDLEDVVREKQRRLQTARGYNMPTNISWRKADLGVTPLSEVLEGKQVDIIIAEGLLGYFDRPDMIRIAAGFYESLRPGGSFIGDVGWREGLQRGTTAGGSLFSRQAGQFKGLVKDESDAVALFSEAGYPEVEVFIPSQVAADAGRIEGPVIDFGLFIVAHKPAAN